MEPASPAPAAAPPSPPAMDDPAAPRRDRPSTPAASDAAAASDPTTAHGANEAAEPLAGTSAVAGADAMTDGDAVSGGGGPIAGANAIADGDAVTGGGALRPLLPVSGSPETTPAAIASGDAITGGDAIAEGNPIAGRDAVAGAEAVADGRASASGEVLPEGDVQQDESAAEESVSAGVSTEGELVGGSGLPGEKSVGAPVGGSGLPGENTAGALAGPSPRLSAREARSPRDMLLSLGVLIVPIALLLIFYRTVLSGDAPVIVDPSPTIQEAQEAKQFTVAVPTGLGSDWHVSSAAFTRQSGGATLRIGYVDPSKDPVQLVESSVPTTTLLPTELTTKAQPLGTFRATNGVWRRYDGRPGEQALVLSDGNRTIIVVGKTGAQNLERLASSLR